MVTTMYVVTTVHYTSGLMGEHTATIIGQQGYVVLQVCWSLSMPHNNVSQRFTVKPITWKNISYWFLYMLFKREYLSEEA